jgi:uncharacterized protein (DUF1501 family)
MPTPLLPSTRREFLRLSSSGIGLLAFGRFAPEFLVQSTRAAPAPEKDRRILVLVQLAGGNDGLNTVVPYQDDDYQRLRPSLALKKPDVLAINDQLGLHPACVGLHRLLQEGRLGVVQNVGYPNPNRSHFRSMEIWETASESHEYMPTGWVGRYLDAACVGAPADGAAPARGGDPLAMNLTQELPQAFGGTQPHPVFSLAPGGAVGARGDATLLEQLAGTSAEEPASSNQGFLRSSLMDALVTEKKVQRVIGAYKSDGAYPSGNFAQALKNTAALIAARLPTRVYFVSLAGFDTHSAQLNAHASLLKQLSEGLAAFQADLTAKGLDGQVLTMTFSEFGRRPSENDSRGTDHGTAAPLFVMGPGLQGGSLHGTAPTLAGLAKNQDLAYTTDFRSVYATVLDRWLGAPADAVLGQRFDRLGFV